MYNDNLKSKFFTYINERIALKLSTKGYYRGDCPFCEGHYTFGINFDTGKSNCFKCDEGKTNLVGVVKFIANVKTFPEVVKALSMVDDYGFIFKAKKEVEEEVVPLELPEGYTRIDMGSGEYHRLVVNYLVKQRGLRKSLLIDRGIGYSTTGHHADYIIIPYINMGKLVYYTARRFIGSGPKFKNPEQTKHGIGKSQVIYNQDALLLYNKVRLVESATNALTLGERGVALGGKSLSPYQKWLILKAPVERYDIILDKDAELEAVELALSIVEHKETKVVFLPDNRDVNQLGRKLANRLIRENTYKNRKDLLSHLRDLKS